MCGGRTHRRHPSDGTPKPRWSGHVFLVTRWKIGARLWHPVAGRATGGPLKTPGNASLQRRVSFSRINSGYNWTWYHFCPGVNDECLSAGWVMRADHRR